MSTPKLLRDKVRLARHILIGASAGGLDAVRTILSVPPLPLPLTLVMHIPPNEKSLLPKVLKEYLSFPVIEPDDKERPLPGHLYVAPPNYHLLFENAECYSLNQEAPVNYSRPSIDLTFETAAEALGAGLVGILLTGANSDGAQGIRRILALGGTAFVQAPQTAYAPEMPTAAIQMSPAVTVLTLPEIRALLDFSS